MTTLRLNVEDFCAGPDEFERFLDRALEVDRAFEAAKA